MGGFQYGRRDAVIFVRQFSLQAVTFRALSDPGLPGYGPFLDGAPTYSSRPHGRSLQNRVRRPGPRQCRGVGRRILRGCRKREPKLNQVVVQVVAENPINGLIHAAAASVHRPRTIWCPRARARCPMSGGACVPLCGCVHACLARSRTRGRCRARVQAKPGPRSDRIVSSPSC